VAAINGGDQIVLVPVYSRASGTGFSAVYTLGGSPPFNRQSRRLKGNLNGGFVTRSRPPRSTGCGDTGGDLA
jgi:hypothetical protein